MRCSGSTTITATLTITNSDDATGPAAERARPGASLMMRQSSRTRLLDISVSAPLRMTTAISSAPEAVIA